MAEQWRTTINILNFHIYKLLFNVEYLIYYNHHQQQLLQQQQQRQQQSTQQHQHQLQLLNNEIQNRLMFS